MRGSWNPGRAVVMTAVLAAVLSPAYAQTRLLFGTVTMEDGSPPPRSVNIQRYCGLRGLVHEASTDRQGRFTMRFVIDDPLARGMALQFNQQTLISTMSSCIVRAALSGYISTTYDLNGVTVASDPHLPALVLRPSSAVVTVNPERLSGRARQPLERGMKASQAGKWPEAEREFRAAVAAEPRLAAGWQLLGGALVSQQKLPEAADALRQAIAADPQMVPAYAMLARVTVAAKRWEDAQRAAAALIRVDTQHAWPEAYFHDALARYNLHDYRGAAESARELLRIDTRRQFPRTELVLGLALAAQNDAAGARQHLAAYLALQPKAADAGRVREFMQHPEAARLEEAPPPPVLSPADARLGPAGEVWIPGGLRALGAIAGVPSGSGYADFFAQYCRSLVRNATPGAADAIASLPAALATYFQVISELQRSGRRRGPQTEVELSLANPQMRRETTRILALLGWKTAGASIEIGDGILDGPRQRIAAALGIDELAMRQTLEAGKTFRFAIATENARLSGGPAWVALTRNQPALPGGVAEAFLGDLRLARAYTALDGMGDDAASAVVAGVGLRAAVETFSGMLAKHGEGLRLAGTAVAVPGGAAAEAAWAKWIGESPHEASKFFRALLHKDGGRALPFYRALAGADESRQRYVTAAPARLSRYYTWFRDTPRAETRLQELPLQPEGGLHFAGGKAAWGAAERDDDALFLAHAEALTALARLERERGATLDEASARLLALHFAEWKPLLPYFIRFSGLGAADLEALAGFADAVRGLDGEARNRRLGQWYSLLEILALARRAGALDDRAAAAAFRRACTALGGRDASAQALELLAALAGGRNGLDAAVRDRLLRLEEARRAAFERVRESQNAPGLESARGDAQVALALSGVVYGAELEPDALPITEDAGFLRRHRFASGGELFAAASLERSDVPPGSRFRGGFADFADAARQLPRAAPVAATIAAVPVAGSAPGPREVEALPRTGSVFRADARLVEVYATVTDGHGRYVDSLPEARFHVLEEGAPQRVSAFESQSAGVSVALLLDTTGSMQHALPALKNAALKLIGELRDLDSVAVYSFAESVNRLQPFTTDKTAAERAVLRTEASGETALYDALTQVAREISVRSGKKVIVVFTDGADNKSVLTAEAAIRRSKNTGAPVYTLAQGGALSQAALVKGLAEISQATGGMAFTIREPGEIRGVLERVAQDLMHGYLLVFPPPPVHGSGWRRIDVRLTDNKDYRVRAREGYYPE